MVVLLIMAILLAIAIPTFLGVKGGAQDRAAQSNLNTALTNAKAVYGNNQTYGTSSATLAARDRRREEPDLQPRQRGVHRSRTTSRWPSTATGNGIILVGKSQQRGTCWGILTNEHHQRTAAATAPPVVAPNTATDAAAIPAWPLNTVAGTYYASLDGRFRSVQR